ncbi:MAG: hypothetical protein QOH31_3653 [Verrucomicrobiota bacterium]|jgi:hypothetical protein
MTIAALSERLGIPTRMLYRYRRDLPDQVPKNFDLGSWIEFIGKNRNYSAERTRSRDHNSPESSAEDQNGERAEFSALAERKERNFAATIVQRSAPHVARSATPEVYCKQFQSRTI